jgi:hypothetical protein
VAALDLAPGKRSGRHTHSIEEVLLALGGTAEMTVGDEKARLSAGEMVLVPALAPHGLAHAGSDELRTVALFPNTAFVSMFDDIISLVESRVLITPRGGPSGCPGRGRRDQRLTDVGIEATAEPLGRSRWKLSWAGRCLHFFNPTCSHGV